MSRKLEILYYTPYFKETLDKALGFEPHTAEDICTVTLDRSRFEQVDAVLFHIPSMKGSHALTKRPGQLWAAMTHESDANYPMQADPNFLQHFDIKMNFRRSSDIPLLYVPGDYVPLYSKPPRAEKRAAPASYVVSNRLDRNNRYEYLEELMKHMQVDSFGKVQNNCTIEQPDLGRSSKHETLSHYHFYLAFENSNSVDYVTEKIFDGFAAGTVPVYMGAPNIDEFLPGDNSIIKVTDFSGPEQLAKYLLSLIENPTEYQKFLEWRSKPIKDDYFALLEFNSVPAIRRLCDVIMKRSKNELSNVSR